MAFTPLTMDGQKAAQTMLGWGTYAKHACLRAVHYAFPFARSDSPGAYTTARVQWDRTPAARRRTGDRNAPAGALVFFDLAVAGIAGRPGHVGISVGGDRFVSTDWPSPGRVGITTIGDVERKWGAAYLGWTDVVGGHNVTVAGIARLDLGGEHWFHYRSAADAEAHRNPQRGRGLLTGSYQVFERSRGGAFRVRSIANGDVWLSPQAAKHAR